jgi:hypothetical protein
MQLTCSQHIVRATGCDSGRRAPLIQYFYLSRATETRQAIKATNTPQTLHKPSNPACSVVQQHNFVRHACMDHKLCQLSHNWPSSQVIESHSSQQQRLLCCLGHMVWVEARHQHRHLSADILHLNFSVQFELKILFTLTAVCAASKPCTKGKSG